MGLCASCQNEEKITRVRSTDRIIYTGPSAWITSNGLHTETQWVHFIQTLLKRKGVLRPEDESSSVTREALVAKYADTLKTLKMTYINDASFHRPEQMMAAGRDRSNPKGWFWWDNGCEDMMGLPRKNITMIQILMKPWLFDRVARLANHDAQAPNVKGLDPADDKNYFAALQLTQDAYNALKETPPKVGAGQAGLKLPGCPASGLSCADELASISTELNKKYKDALDRWCDEYIDGADFICGQGGEVVMLNMAWQCNQEVASRLVRAVRGNKAVYLGLSASSMVAAKSMEMTGEIEPGWIEAFSAHSDYLHRDHFTEVDLDGDGTAVNVLGALPLFESPLAMRPHFSEAWEAEVLRKNLEAERECEQEAGLEIDDELVAHSKDGVETALNLLNVISAAGNSQDNPVFVPLRNGKAFEVNFHSDPYREVFYVRN